MSEINSIITFYIDNDVHKELIKELLSGYQYNVSKKDNHSKETKLLANYDIKDDLFSNNPVEAPEELRTFIESGANWEPDWSIESVEEIAPDVIALKFQSGTWVGEELIKKLSEFLLKLEAEETCIMGHNSKIEEYFYAIALNGEFKIIYRTGAGGKVDDFYYKNGLTLDALQDIKDEIGMIFYE